MLVTGTVDCFARTSVSLDSGFGRVKTGRVDDGQVISFMIAGDALRRAASAAAGAVLLVSCSTPVEGTSTPDTRTSLAESTQTQVQEPYAWLTAVLPTDSELSEALGYPVTVDGPPKVRDGAKLRNTFIGSGEVAERDCIGVVSPLEKEAYGSAPVIALTFATEAAATYGAAAFESVAGAGITFQSFADRWRDCDGRTVVKSVGDHRIHHVISEVQVTENTLSAIDTLNSSEGVPVVTGRALGVAHDCIVEVELAYDDPEEFGRASEHALLLVEAMLGRVRTP